MRATTQDYSCSHMLNAILFGDKSFKLYSHYRYMSSPAVDERKNLLCKYWAFLLRVFYYTERGNIITDTHCLL